MKSTLYWRERGVIKSSVPGFHGQDVERILTYNLKDTWKVLLPFLSPRLTTCYNVYAWLKHVAWVLYALCVTIFCAHFAYDSPWGEESEFGTKLSHPCNDKANFKSNMKMCQLEERFRFWKTEFRFLIAFMLAGIVAAAVRNWRARRTMYASLCGCTRNLTVKMAGYIPIDKNNKQLTLARKNLGRWTSLAFELAVLKARGKMDSDEGRDYLLREGLMEPGEWETMVKGDRHSTVFFWVHTQTVWLGRGGFIATQAVRDVSEAIGAMRAKANDLMSCLDFDLPVTYTTLCGALVTLNVFIMSTAQGFEWSQWLRFHGPTLYQHPKIYFDIFGLFAWNLSYKALFELVSVLHNPFGNRVIDVAHELIGNGLRKLQESLMEGESHIPPTMTMPTPVEKDKSSANDHIVEASV